jgi:prepilin-type processing-associated H-X9-DG protein
MILGRQPASSQNAVMLVELMIVIAIILVLFVLYWGGGLGGSKLSKQRDFTSCAKNLQTIHTALLTFSSDHNDAFPFSDKAQHSEDVLSVLMPKYISQSGPFICPASSHRKIPEGESIAKKKISYGYVMGFGKLSDPYQWVMSDEQVNTNSKSQGDPVFASTNKPPGNNHGGYGGNLLMIDGSVKDIAPKAPYSLALTNTARYLNPQPTKD